MISVAEEKEHEEEEEEEFEKLDLSDTLAPAVVMREVGNINDLPEELLLEIFLCLPPATVLEAAAVCQTWASVVLSASFWRSKLSRLGVRLSDSQQRNKNWRIFYALCNENPWERNLLRNSSGEENRGRVGLLYTFLLSYLPTYFNLRWGSATGQRRIFTQTGSTVGPSGLQGAVVGALIT